MLAFLRAQTERFTRGEALVNVVAGAY